MVELIVVIGMVVLLSVLALVSYRGYIRWARTAQGRDIVAALANAQHQYNQDTGGYLDCSASLTDYYPRAPNSRKHAYHDQSHASYPCFRLLHNDSDGATFLSFIVLAGDETEGPPTLPTTYQVGTVPAGLGWYVIMAVGDYDEDGEFEYIVATSTQPGEVHIENE
ncbi:MAG: hypothetical protein AAGA56_18290, partial [Myxococcota bacterium]